MTRLDTTRARLTRGLQAVAGKLIGFGGALVLMPLFFVRSPFSQAMRAFAPFGWLALLVGFGLLTLEMRQQSKVVAARRTRR